MSNKILCACGKHHRTDQPLVITITACPKKKHPSHITTEPLSPKTHPSPDGSQHDQPLPSPRESMPKKLVTPTGSQAYPTFVSPKQSDFKKHPTSTVGSHDKPHVSPKRSSAKRPVTPEKKQTGKTESYDHILICEDAGVAVPSNTAETPLIDNSTLCDLDEVQHSMAEKAPDKRVLGTQMDGPGGTFFDPSHEFNTDEEELKTNRNRPPSDTEMKLPILVPRYHGPGCAMEVDVMEKHDHNCRYRKKKNPERNPVDDRSGSYEVIGRLKFKTCHPEPALISQEFKKIHDNTSQSAKVATIYSLFNIPHKVNSKKVCLSTSESKRRLEKYLRRKKILEDLTKSVKSFPSQSKKCVEDPRKIINFEQGVKKVSSVSSENITSCEVEVLYFCENTGSKSIQFTKEPRTRLISLKRWLYHILPCVSMEESQTRLLGHARRSSG